MFYLSHTPFWLRLLFPAGCTWQMPATDNAVYLSFDDGPHPVATGFVLDTLQQYGAKASFFCIGKNVALHPELFERIQREGHTVANHTMHHLNGWKTDAETYLKDIADAGRLIPGSLFRPPYGRISRRQAQLLRKQNPDLKIIMWSILSGDFDEAIDGQQCFENVKRHLKPGSIIVFHDSAKAFPRLQTALPLVLEWLRKQGYRMEALG